MLDEGNLKELTLRGILLGALITVIFTASNVYLGLKVGLTFASSIPAAVISMAVLNLFKNSTILENNMVQTQASAAGTLSSVIFILPGLLLLGYWQDFPFLQTFLISTSGGILGVIFTIPLRHSMVVKSHLPYPEGVAAAEILKAGNSSSKENSGVKEILSGGIIASAVGFLTNGLRIVSDSSSFWFKASNAIFQIPMGFSLALLGAGYLVGIVGGLAIFLGIFLTWAVAVPYFTVKAGVPTDANISEFALNIWSSKVRFIGVGTIGIAAIWTLLSLMKSMFRGLMQSFQLKRNNGELNSTDIDLSPKTMLGVIVSAIFLIILALYEFIANSPISMESSILLVACSTALAVFIGFLVAAACGYMAGLVGSSSSPISGIGILSVVVIATVLMLVGSATGLVNTQEGKKFLTALTIFTSSIVLSTAAISNDNLQDLKTGHLVSATPWKQQIALIIGCVVGALVIAPVLEILYNAYGFTNALPRPDMNPSVALSAPQATLMTTIAHGIFAHDLEWSYINMGIGLGVILIILDIWARKLTNQKFAIPALAVGMGIYLPPSINMPIVIGAVMAWFINHHLTSYAKAKQINANELHKKAERFGTLFAAGLIVGESLVGVLLAFIIAGSVTAGGSDSPLALELSNWDTTAELLGLGIFIGGILIYVNRVLKAKHA